MSLPVPNLQQLASSLPKEVQPGLRGALWAQDRFNHDVSVALDALGQWTWLTPQLANGWTNFSASLIVRYALLPSGLVVLSGAMASGTLGSAAFTLPINMRPAQDANFAVDSNDAFGKLTIHASGEVIPAVGSNVFFAIDGCAFLPAQAGA